MVLPPSIRHVTRSGSSRSRGLTDEFRTAVDFCTYRIRKTINRKGGQGDAKDQADDKIMQGHHLSGTALMEDDDLKTSSSECEEDGALVPNRCDIWDSGLVSSKCLDRLLGAGAGNVRAASFQHVNRITPEGLFRPWESMLEVMDDGGVKRIYRKGMRYDQHMC